MESNCSNPGKLRVKSRVWIEDEDGKVVFGAGRLRILELVDRFGSMHVSAKELNMSYRAVWGKFKASEERLGQTLVQRPDGTTRSGSTLTPFANTIMESFRRLQAVVKEEADRVFEGSFSSGRDVEISPKTTAK